ncbi:hypothetical protein PUN28_015658 [Cardiocondyla obscurior]|uniref:Uncharacterized protein n=1 Tax=Cardiocondyla obscurior TaxID=286306 RepID=A0AAW2EXS0_9HYME
MDNSQQRNIPDHTIKDVFRTTMCFTKLNMQENNTFGDTFDTQNMDRVIDNNIPSLKQNSLNDNVPNFKSLLSETFPFRGFTPSEISMIPNHIKNADSLSHLNDNARNYLERSSKYQVPSHEHHLNKKYSVPDDFNVCNSIGESHLCHSKYRTGYQDTCSTKICNKTDITEDLEPNKISQRLNNVRCKRFKDTFDTQSSTSHMIIDVDQHAAIKQTKSDIYKMDVCQDEDQNIIINTDDLLPTTRDKLKTSISNFLKRAQEEIFVELSGFPRIKSYPQMGSSNVVDFTSKERKSETPSKILNYFASVSSNDNMCMKQQDIDINVKENQKKSTKRTKQKVISYDNRSQKKCNFQEFNKVAELQSQRSNLNYDAEKKVAECECKEKNTGNVDRRCKTESKLDNIYNLDDSFQARSMFQLAAYKKRYYNTLLNVQKAKVAISNSSASPSDHLTVYDDPYYTNYIRQQQHLLHQQRHLTERSQFLTCPMDLSGLSSMHCEPYSWARSICKYLLLKQLRLERQTLPRNPQNQSGWIHRHTRHGYPYFSVPNESDETKYRVRRQNLEEIVGKLKETEPSNFN